MRIKNTIIQRLKQLFIKTTDAVPENWHEDFIVNLAKVVKPKVYVELGLYQSALFNKMIPYADKLIGVEMDGTLKKFMKKSSKTTFKKMTTDAYAKELQKKPIKIDMIFIDANHDQKSVLKDFAQYFPFVAPHGLILLHDGYPKNNDYTASGYCSDAYKAIEKLSHQTKELEMMTIPVHPGLTICRKRRNQLMWKEA